MTSMAEDRWTDPPLPPRAAWLDLLRQPCQRQWGPELCPGPADRGFVAHLCLHPSATPHVCQCWQGCWSQDDGHLSLPRRGAP